MVAVVLGLLACAVGSGSLLWSARQSERPAQQRKYDRMGAVLLLLTGVALLAYPLPAAFGLPVGYQVLTRVAGAVVFIVAVVVTLTVIERRAR